MIEANGGGLVTLALCGLCVFLSGALVLATFGFLRRKGTIALPLVQALFDRHEADDDDLDVAASRRVPPPRPDLRAIARQHDFDQALARQGVTPAPPPPAADPEGWDPSANPLLRRMMSSPYEDELRQRDENDEMGYDAQDL